MSCLKEVREKIEEVLGATGFEYYPFKVDWYNAQVEDAFQLDYPPDTVAFIMLSTPAVFDKAFKPFICRQECTGVRDPIDECMAHQFQLVKQAFPDQEVDCMHDFELHHSRRPKVLVQTAGHVAAAARYYQRKDVVNDPWDEKQKIFGVSVHPKYGGWFALRGVLVFTGLQCPELERKEPPDVVPDDPGRIELLKRFNFSWKDWSFRDIIPVEERYSEEQKQYYGTAPKDRGEIIDKLRGADGVTT